jgi:HSP20 family protein
MSNLVSPLDILGALNSRHDDWFGRSALERSPATDGRWLPAVDIRLDDGKYIVEMDVPGFTSNQVEVSVEDRVMSVRGTRSSKEKTEQEGYLRAERSSGTFLRQFSLPASVEANNIAATVRDGVLTVEIPQAQAVQPQKIAVS